MNHKLNATGGQGASSSADGGRRSKVTRGRVFAFLLAASVLAPGCGGSGSAVPPEAEEMLAEPPPNATGTDRLPKPKLGAEEKYEVELADNIDFIDDHPDIDSIEADGTDGIIITPKKGKKPALGKGRIILSRRHALAHWVDAVTVVNGKPRFKLRPAKLTEVFKKIDIDAEVDLTEIQLKQPPSKSGAIVSPLVILDKEGTKEFTKKFSFNKTFLDTNNLDAGAKGNLSAGVKLWIKIYYDAKLGKDDCTLGASLKFESESDFDAWFKANASYSKSGETSLGSGIQIGWSFGVVSGVIDLDLVLNYEIKATGKINAHLDAGYDDFTFKVGAKYKCGSGWSKIQNFSPPKWHNSHEVTAEGSVEALLYPAFEAAILVYGAAGPELAIGPAFEGKATAEASAKSDAALEACVKLSAALRAELNFVVDALGLKELAEKNFGTWDIKSWDIFDECWSFCTKDIEDGTVEEGGFCCTDDDCKKITLSGQLGCKNNVCKKAGKFNPPAYPDYY